MIRTKKFAATFLLMACIILHTIATAYANNTNNTAKKATAPLDYSTFAKFPILHEGRIKPLDSFARILLLGISSKSEIEGMSAIEHLAELLFDTQRAYQRRVFDIPNPDVVSAIDLPPRRGHKYSFSELSAAIRSNEPMIRMISSLESSSLSKAQYQLLSLYDKTMLYFETSRSLSIIIPEIEIHDDVLAAKMGVEPNTPVSYDTLVKNKKILSGFAKILEEKSAKGEDFTKTEIEVIRVASMFRRLDMDSRSQILRVIPPQWASEKGNWTSPWGVLQEGASSPQTKELFTLWQELATAWRSNDADEWSNKSAKIHEIVTEKDKRTGFDTQRIKIEYLYNKANLFKYSLAAYIAAFFTSLLYFIRTQQHSKVAKYHTITAITRNRIRLASIALVTLGILAHLAGILARIYIMQRPPVATLYESIIFVGFICVLFSLLIEWNSKNGIGVLMGAITGGILQFISMRYTIDGDSMGMLAAVLDTNFWLATHVLTITIGYGACFIAGFLGHAYLFMRVFSPKKDTAIKALATNMYGILIVALFFSVLGTILGGIWADQSWGRFWGWDPKENGAMLICLWLTFILHARYSGILRPLSFAVCVVITNIVVSTAWFGVNLLNVGLHSYGFTQGIAVNLMLFFSAELLFILTMLLLLKIRNSQNKRHKIS